MMAPHNEYPGLPDRFSNSKYHHTVKQRDEGISELLRSKNVYLSPIEKGDSPILYKWINEREQVHNNAPFKPVHSNQHEAWLKDIQKRNDIVVFGIRLLETNHLIGTCQLHSIHPINQCAELQIRVGEPSERGKGYGTEAIHLLLKFAFMDLNLNRVYLHVFNSNTVAIRVYEKTGFKIEGKLRQATFVNGKFEDLLVMGFLREEY